MESISYNAPSDSDFYRNLDERLEGADVSLSALHQVLDQLGAPEGQDSQTTSPSERLGRLIVEHLGRNTTRVQIGCGFQEHPRWKFLAGVPLIYLPILVGLLPMIICALLIRTHLTLVGGHHLKSYWVDFVPSWVSHRYTRESQIIPNRLFERYRELAWIAKSKLFWVFNCKLYCPLSIALIAYLLYLVKIVEQWWCPFDHDKKATYTDVPIDKSFWHAAGDENLLHPEDRENPSWNKDAT